MHFKNAGMGYLEVIEATHLLPRSFEVRTAHSSSQRVVCRNGGAPPPKATVRFFTESLPHLLPRQAFSILEVGLPFLPLMP